MTKQKLLAAGTLATLAIATLAACGDDPQGGASGDDASSYAAVIKGLDNPFFQAMEQGINAQATADEVSVDGPGRRRASPTPPARPTSSTRWPSRATAATSSTRSRAPT